MWKVLGNRESSGQDMSVVPPVPSRCTDRSTLERIREESTVINEEDDRTKTNPRIMCGIYEVLEVVKVGATGVIHRGRAKRSDWIRSAPDQLKVNSTLETHPQAAVPALGSKQESAHVNLFLKLEALEAPRQQMVNEWRVYESLSRTVGLPPLPPGVGGFPTARFDLDRGNGDDNARGGDGQDGTEVTLGTASSSSGRSSSTKGRHLSGGISSAGSSAQRVLAMEALGPDLGALLSSTRGGRLGLKSVLALGEQMVDLLRTFHAAGWAHRDIKPENFCVGAAAAATGGNGNGNGNDLDASARLFLIDFGVATPLRSPSSLASAESAVQKITPAAIGEGGGGGGLFGNENNNTSDGVGNRCDQDRGGGAGGGAGAGAAMVGSLRYLSARAHECCPLVGALDDLESVAYVLLWLFKGGSLPWQGLPTGAGTGRGAANPSSSSQQKQQQQQQQQQQADPKRVKRAAVGLLKQQLTPEALCGTDCPCLAEYLTLVRSMMKAEEERYAAEVVRRRRVGGGGGGGGGAAAWAVAAQTSSEVGEGGRLLGEATREEASAVVDYGKLRRVFGRWRTRRGILDDGRFEWNRQSIHQEPTPQLRPQPTTITAAAAAAEVEALTHGVVPLVSLYGELPPPAPSAGHGDTASSTATSSDNNDDDDDDDDDGGDGGGDRSTTKRNSQVCALSERSTSGNKSNEVDSSEEVTLPNVSVSSSSLSSSSLLSSSLHSSAVSSSSSSPALSSPPTATGTGERVSPAVSTAAMVEQQATQGTKEVGDGMTATETTARRKRRCPPFEPPPSDLRPGCSVLKQPGAAAADGSGGGGGAGEAGVERENEKRSLDGDSREANSSSRSSGSGGGSSKRARIVHWFSHGSSSSSSNSSSSSSSSHGVAPAAATGEAAVVARSDEAVERAKGDDEKGGNEMDDDDDDDDEKGAPCVEREGGGCPVSEEWVLKGLGPANLWEAFVANSEQQHGGTGSGGSGGGTDDEKLLARWRAQLSSSSGGADKTQAAAAAAAAASGDGGGVSLSFASTLPLPKAEHSIATPSSEAYSSSAAAAAAPPPASGTSAKMNAVAALLKIVPHLRDSSSKKAPKALGLLATLLRAECRASNAPEFHAALAVSLGGDARRIHGPNRQLRNGYASLFGSVASGDVLSLFEASAARPKLALWCVAAFVFNRCLPAPGQSPLPANPTAAAAAAAAAAATTTTTPPPPLVASSTSSDWCAGLSEDNFGEVVGTLSELLDVMLGDDKGGGGGQGQGFVAKKSANTKNGALGSGSDASAAMATLSPVAEDLFKARLVDVLKRLYEGFSRDSWMVPVAPAASATTSGSGSQGLAGASGSSGVAGGLGAPSATGFAQGPSAGELARRAQEVDARRTIMLQTNRSTVLECFDKALRLPAGFWPPPAGRAQRTQLERMRSTMHARR